MRVTQQETAASWNPQPPTLARIKRLNPGIRTLSPNARSRHHAGRSAWKQGVSARDSSWKACTRLRRSRA